MLSQLKDWRLFLRFFTVNGFGTIVDYAAAVALASLLSVNDLIATALGFLLGTGFNYVGHSLFSYEHTGRHSLSLTGFAKYLLAVLATLAVRLAAVAGLGAATPLPFWIILIIAIGMSFLVSYVVATLWVFKKPEE